MSRFESIRDSNIHYPLKMVKFGLNIKVNMSNVDKLYPTNPEQFTWPLKVRCTGCGEENPNWHLISEEEEVELATSTANFVYKCKCCARENSLTVLHSNHVNSKKAHQKKLFETIYLSDDEDKFKTIISFDCRGLEPFEFEPRDGWTVTSGKKVFEDVDLSTKEWVDYNDIDNVPVEITSFESCFEVLK